MAALAPQALAPVGTTAPQATPVAARPPRPQIRDAASPLVLYVALLFVLPSGLVFEPLGAAGSPASVLGMGFLAWWLNARLVPRLGVDRGAQPVRVGLYAFQLVAAASFLAGCLRPMTSEESSSSLRGVLTVCAWSGIVLVTSDGLRSRASLDRVLRAVVWAGVFLALLGIIQFFTGWNAAAYIKVPGLHANQAFAETGIRSNFTRIQGTAAHAIEFGVVLAMVLPLALHYAWFATDKRKLRWAGVACIGFALPMTVSRSAILGLTVVLLVMMITWPPQRRKMLLRLLPFGAVALKLMIPGLLGTLTGLFANAKNDPSTQGRTDDYAAAGYYIHHSPLFGRGISTFIPELYRTLDNAYLGWLIEAGLVGLVVMLVFFISVLGVGMHSRLKARGDEETRDLGAALVAGLLATLLNLATFDGLGFAMCAGLFFLLIGAVGALWRLAVPSDPITQPILSWQEQLRRPRKSPGLAFQAAGALAGIGLVMLPGVVQTQYSAAGSVLLRGPFVADGLNPYGYQPYLDLPSEIAQRVVMSPVTKADLRARGFSDDYTVAAGIGSLMPQSDKRGVGVVIRLDVRADTADQALVSLDAVIKALQDRFAQAQLSAGSPPTELITATVGPKSDVPAMLTGNQHKSMLMGGAIGFALGGITWHIIGRLLRARRRAARIRSARAFAPLKRVNA